MQSVLRIACEGRSPSSIRREAQDATLHGKSVSLNFAVSQETLRSLERVLSEQKSFGASVVALNISDSKLNVENLVAVSALFARSPLQTIVMERCGIDDRAAPVLAELAAKCPKLCTLNVRSNALTDAGAQVLHKCALRHPCLQSVACDGCPVSVRRQKQLYDIPKRTAAAAAAAAVFSPPAPTPHPTPFKAPLFSSDGSGHPRDNAARSTGTPSSRIADSTRLEWSALTQKQPLSKSAGRSSSVPRFQSPSPAPVHSALPSNPRSITQEAIDAMFSPTPRNLHNRIFARSHKLKSAAAAPPPRAVARGRGVPREVSNPTNGDDFGDLLKDQQLEVLQSHCRSLEAEVAEQQQLLQAEQKRSAAAESQCLQLQHMQQQHSELVAVMRRDLHRALSTVQAVTQRCSQLIRDRNVFRDQKRSFEQLIGSFVSGVTSVGAPSQHLHDAVDNFAVASQQSLAQETDDLEDGNKELMELLRSIWGNTDGQALAHGEQPTPAIARVARDFQMESTPGAQTHLVKQLLPHFGSHPHSSAPAHLDAHAAASDSDFDDINRFLNSRVACVLHTGSSSATQIAAQCAKDAAADRDGSVTVTPADATARSAVLHPSSNEAPALHQAPAVAATSTTSAPAQDFGSQVMRSYEELQIQLHTGTATAVAAGTPAETAKKPSVDEGMESTSEAALASVAQLKAAALLDPAQDSEMHHHMTVQPVSQGLLQSSPHSSTDSLASMLPTETTPSEPQATAAAAQTEARAGYSIASDAQSPGISSPRTYEELQIALQRGYTRTSPKIEQKSASADFSLGNGSSDSATRAMRDKQSAQGRAHIGSKEAGKKSRSKQIMSSSQSSKNGESTSTSGGKIPLAAVGAFNLPTSFFS